jgi:hypothetical protein
MTTQGAEIMRVTQGGNVGIGTTLPNAKLNVQSTTGGSILLSQPAGSLVTIGTTLGEVLFDNGNPVNDASAVIRALAADNMGSSNKGADLLFMTKAAQDDNVDPALERMRITDDGNVGIGTSTPGHQLSVGTTTTDGQAVSVRGYSNSPANWKGGGAFGYSSANVIMGQLGGVAQLGGHNGALTAWATLALNSGGGNVGVGTTTPVAKFDSRGTATINNGNNYANTNNFMASGSLTIGGINSNYGGGSGWTGNTAGLMLEALDNTEIGIHDSGHRIASAMYYQGGGTNRITIGRDMGWGTTNVAVATLAGAGNDIVYADPSGVLVRSSFDLSTTPQGTGTTNYLARWTSSTALGTGVTYDNGTNVGLSSTNPQAKLHVVSDYPFVGGSDGMLKIKSYNNGGCCGTEAITLQTSIDNRADDYSISGYGGDSRHVLSLQPQGGYVGVGTANPLSLLHVTGKTNIHQSGGGGGQNLFQGLESPTSANGRAQLVLSSAYSDLVIASSQGNNSHGSTLTFASYNPGNAGDYRKFVVNQGNWGNRMHFLDFGYANTGGRTNPHSNINVTDNVLTLDGLNKRVGILTMDPSTTLDVHGQTTLTRDGSTECCSGGDYTLAIAESTTSSGRRASISFHNGGEAEGTIRLTQGYNMAGLPYNERRLHFFDWQSNGLGLELEGNLYYGNNSSRTQTRDNNTLAGNSAGVLSGFYETSSATAGEGYPTNASSWWHLIDARHSNSGNNYAMQIAGSFYDQDVFVRKTNNNGGQAWARVVTSRDISSASIYGNTGYNNSDIWYDVTGWTNYMDVSPGDKIKFDASFNTRLTGGSGNDDYYWYIEFNGCANGNILGTSDWYRPAEDGSDHDNRKQVSFVNVWDCNCNGQLRYRLWVQNVGDDNWEISRRVLVATRY